MTVALRILAQGAAYDVFDERFGISESTAAATLEHFVDSIIHLYKDEYLRLPTEEEITQIMQNNKERGFPGCIGSIDCQYWVWKSSSRLVHFFSTPSQFLRRCHFLYRCLQRKRK